MEVKLLGFNSKEAIQENVQVVATAARISRTQGKVLDIYEDEHTMKENLQSIKHVLNSGHTSISDHDYLVFALEDVTPVIEQTLIGYRLTSFTIKSRREANFSNEGHFNPDFRDNEGNVHPDNEELKRLYNAHADKLFNFYNRLVNKGIPFEDARYILPYSFHANIIMGMDATELLKVLTDLLYGNLSKNSELKELGERIYAIVQERAPYLIPPLNKAKDRQKDELEFLDDIVGDIEPTKGVLPRIVNFDSDGDLNLALTTLAARYQLSFEDAHDCLKGLLEKDPDIVEKIIRGVVFNTHNRELEAVNYEVEFSPSLAVLTHFTRHRMYSLLVPDFAPIRDLSSYKIPESIKESDLEEYEQVFADNLALYEEFKSRGVNEQDLVYFYMAGNTVNVRATINARTLIDISRKRTCRKTQWETRGIVQEICDQAKKATPIIGRYLGPSCEVLGYCKEGKDSCKRGVQRLVLEDKPSKE